MLKLEHVGYAWNLASRMEKQPLSSSECSKKSTHYDRHFGPNISEHHGIPYCHLPMCSFTWFKTLFITKTASVSHYYLTSQAYYIHLKYWTPSMIYLSIIPILFLFLSSWFFYCLKYCWGNSRQCRPRSDSLIWTFTIYQSMFIQIYLESYYGTL